MGLFGALFEVATTPLAVVADIVTLGGAASGEDKSYTRQKVEAIDDEIKDIFK